MRLYVMRHGPAEDRAPSGRDFDRALTHAGRAVVDRAARALHQARAGTPVRVLSSPFRRARETAELLSKVIGAGEPEIHDDLAADADLPLALVRDVHAAGGDAILIGHQPIVEELVRVLLHPGHGGGLPREAELRSASRSAPHAPARPSLGNGFRTATIAALEHAAERWRLVTVIDPHAAG